MSEFYEYEEEEEKNPLHELQVDLNFYRRFINRMGIWDAFEAGAYISCRDDIQWALEQLDGNVDEAILKEIEELDERLKGYADYLTNELQLFKHIYRDDPKEHWWWYLDEFLGRSFP